MRKPVLGMVVGAVLGFVDGLAAWFRPMPVHTREEVCADSRHILKANTCHDMRSSASRVSRTKSGSTAGTVLGSTWCVVNVRRRSRCSGRRVHAVPCPPSLLALDTLVALIPEAADLTQTIDVTVAPYAFSYWRGNRNGRTNAEQGRVPC